MKLFARASASKAVRRKGRVAGIALSAGLLLPIGALTAGVITAAPASASVSAFAGNGSTYHALTPYRLVDTRQNSGQQFAGGTLTAGRSLTVTVSPSGTAPNNVPRFATAVVLNITAVNPSSTGYLTAFAAGQTVPFISTVNFVAGQTVANQATVTLGNSGNPFDGQVTIFNFTGSTDVLVDVQGYYTQFNTNVPGPFPNSGPGAGYNPITNPVTGNNEPVRVLDTRVGSGQQGEGETLGPDSTLNFFPGTSTFPFATAVVPPDATAVVLNVTAATSTADSFLTVWTTGAAQPLASNLNFTAGNIVPNRVIVPINPVTKQVSIFNFAGNTDVVVDLDGYFTPFHGSRYFPLVTPQRIVDTRPGSGAPYSGQTLGTGTILTTNIPKDTFPPVGPLTVFAPANFTGIDANITVTDTDANGGFLTVYPSNAGGPPPLASDLNWNAGGIVSNADLLSSGSVPTVSMNSFNFTGSADLVVDLYGYFGPFQLHPDM